MLFHVLCLHFIQDTRQERLTDNNISDEKPTRIVQRQL